MCRCPVPFLLAVAAFGVWRNRSTTLVAAVYSWVWRGLQGLQWWPAYLFDADAEWYADHGYDETTRWLPRIGDNQVVIDAQHTVLQSLSLLAAVLSTVAAVLVRRLKHGRTEGRRFQGARTRQTSSGGRRLAVDETAGGVRRWHTVRRRRCLPLGDRRLPDIIGCTITRRPIASKGRSLAHRGTTTDRAQPARGRYRGRHDARRHGLVTTWGVANPIERIHGHAIV